MSGETLDLGSTVEARSRELGAMALRKARLLQWVHSISARQTELAHESVHSILQLKGSVRMISFKGVGTDYDPSKEDVPLSSELPPDEYVLNEVRDEEPDRPLLILEPVENPTGVVYTVLADAVRTAEDDEIRKNGRSHPKPPPAAMHLTSEE